MVAWQIKSSETQGQKVASGESQTGESGAEKAYKNEQELTREDFLVYSCKLRIILTAFARLAFSWRDYLPLGLREWQTTPLYTVSFLAEQTS